MTTKNHIFEEFLLEYLSAEPARKGEILNHVTAVTTMHRKAAIRKFRAIQMKGLATQERRGTEQPSMTQT